MWKTRRFRVYLLCKERTNLNASCSRCAPLATLRFPPIFKPLVIDGLCRLCGTLLWPASCVGAGNPTVFRGFRFEAGPATAVLASSYILLEEKDGVSWLIGGGWREEVY